MNPTSTTTQGTPMPTVSLVKITNSIPELATPTESGLAYRRSQSPRRPWYPLVGHREGLRRNDMITLHSALFILALEGGTVHQAPIPGTIVDGKVIPFDGYFRSSANGERELIQYS